MPSDSGDCRAPAPRRTGYREIRIRRIDKGPGEVQRLIMTRDLRGGSSHEQSAMPGRRQRCVNSNVTMVVGDEGLEPPTPSV